MHGSYVHESSGHSHPHPSAAGVFPLLHKLLARGGDAPLLCSRDSLRDYVLYCCQDERGGCVAVPECGWTIADTGEPAI